MTDDKIDQFCAVPIKVILKYGEDIPFDVYLKLSDSKIVKISHESENIKEIFLKYQDKGVKEIFASKENFEKFAHEFRQKAAKIFNDAKTTTSQKVEILGESHQILKTQIAKLGVSEVAIDMARDIGNNTLELISQITNIFSLFQEFREKCEEEFMDALLIGYTASIMLDAFDWQSKEVKRKLFMASMLCDVTLDKNEIAELKKLKNNPKSLSKKVYNHPLDTVKLLSEGAKSSPVSPEVLLIIEQHHEQPHEKGFPRRLDYHRIVPLAAIYIVAADFIELMKEHNFDFEQKGTILEAIWNKYNKGNYKKATDALHAMLK